jgi:flagellar biogenesis protein FliO
MLVANNVVTWLVPDFRSNLLWTPPFRRNGLRRSPSRNRGTRSNERVPRACRQRTRNANCDSRLRPQRERTANGAPPPLARARSRASNSSERRATDAGTNCWRQRSSLPDGVEASYAKPQNTTNTTRPGRRAEKRSLDLMLAGRSVAACAVVALVLAAVHFATRGLARVRSRASAGGRLVTVLETTILPGAASLHVVRIGDRYALIGRSGSTLAALGDVSSESIDRWRAS